MLKIGWSRKKKRNYFNEAIYMKNGEHRFFTSSICNHEEVGVFMELYLRLLSLLKVLSYWLCGTHL
jgi:hypothetical protein